MQCPCDWRLVVTIADSPIAVAADDCGPHRVHAKGCDVRVTTDGRQLTDERRLAGDGDELMTREVKQ